MYIRGRVQEELMGREISAAPLDDEDKAFLTQVLKDYAAYFGADISKVSLNQFTKYQPKSKRPYGNMYVGN